MAYQLNEEQLKDALNGGYTTADEDDSWMERSDNGYGDRYRALISKLEFVRSRYRDQLDYLPRKKEELAREHRRKLIHMLLMLFLPLVLFLFTYFVLAPLADKNGFFSFLYFFIMYLCLPVLSVACFFYFLPVTARDYFNCLNRVRKLGWKSNVIYGADFWESITRDVEYGNRKNITFQEEEQFLRSILGYYDWFLQQAEAEDWEHLGRKEDGVIDLSEGYTPDQQRVIDTMERLSKHVDVQARIGDERKESGPVTLVVGAGIMMAIVIAIVII